ncbi:MAG: helix-turn-helix transcriptional regulator, partial [Lachnospiraceae bacterium]|nr:helix-turn-helix transcriptional regulator [Lachnospiraceae bacterium]
MKKEEIGKMVKYERTKKNINIKDLSCGICSPASLKRLEHGVRLPDFFLLERIIERLGKSMNKVEFLHDEHTYDICYLRELIEDYVIHNEYEKAEDALGYYEELEEAREPLHIQYICKMRAVLAEKCGTDSTEIIEKAMNQTMNGFSLKNIRNYILGEEEIILLLMWLKVKGDEGAEDVKKYGEEVLRYIEYTFSDEEVLANVYSKAAWVFIEALEKENRTRDALHLCIKSIELLTGNGMLLHLPQYLELILKLEKESGDEYIEWKKQRDALKWIYEEHGYKYDTEEIELWKNYRLNEACLISELIGEERKTLNQTQEEMAFETEMDQKTISRIENGKYKPKQGTFQKLKEYMEFDRDICNTHIVVDDFELLELEREVARECSFRRFEKAEKLYEKLKARLSMEFNENVQYVKFMDCYLRKNIHNDIAEEEFIQQLIEAFRITRRNSNINDLGKVVLTKNEAEIIHKIALAYERLNRREEGIKLLEMVTTGYENSRVDTKYHYRGLMLAYQSLCRMYEVDNQLKKAIDLCMKGVRFELRCYRGLTIAFIIEQRACAQERLDGDKEVSRYYYRQAYQFM